MSPRVVHLACTLGTLCLACSCAAERMKLMRCGLVSALPTHALQCATCHCFEQPPRIFASQLLRAAARCAPPGKASRRCCFVCIAGCSYPGVSCLPNNSERGIG